MFLIAIIITIRSNYITPSVNNHSGYVNWNQEKNSKRGIISYKECYIGVPWKSRFRIVKNNSQR